MTTLSLSHGEFQFKHHHNPDAKMYLAHFTTWSCWTTMQARCKICGSNEIVSETYEVTLRWSDMSPPEYISEVCPPCMDGLNSKYAPPAIDVPTDDRHLIKMLKATITMTEKGAELFNKLAEKEKGHTSFYMDIYVIQSDELRNVHTALHLESALVTHLWPPECDLRYGYYYNTPSYMMSYDGQSQIMKPDEPVSRLGVKFYYLDSNGKHDISQTSVRWTPSSNALYELDDRLSLTIKLGS